MSRPVYREETETWKYNRANLPVRHKTRGLDVALGDILIPLVLAGFLTLGPLALNWMREQGEETAEATGHSLTYYRTIYGPVIGPVLYARYHFK